MDSTTFRNWRVLCWNVHGLNSADRQRDLRVKIEESNCSIVCLQEMKIQSFDLRLVRTFYPCRFDNFVYSPSEGASGGILVAWNSAMFTGTLIQSLRYGIIVSFTSVHNAEKWTMVSVYGPCSGPLRDEFVNWLYNLHIPDDEHWLFLGYFNFIRSLENKNRLGGDINDIFFSMRLLDI